MSIRPKRSAVVAARRLVSSSFETSIRSARPSLPRSRISCSTSLACESRMSPMTTLAPSRAKRRAYSRPMPWPPPVVMATLSFKRMVVLVRLTGSCSAPGPACAGSWDRLQLELKGGSSSVGDVWLPPDLDGKRHDDERVQELQQPVRVVWQVVERKLVQVDDCFLGAREARVVERLHVLHRARQTLRVAFGLVGNTPCLGKGLEVGELRGEQAIGHRSHTPARERW